MINAIPLLACTTDIAGHITQGQGWPTWFLMAHHTRAAGDDDRQP